ncbi:hypothetical protein GE061_019147 [Apolygus lucorum]|uniref:Pyridoxal kinase n=1 Tax=Apolygus lucorum TaxID=248454 RepID=A0A8S9X7A3_APOLU|nr:hypothetical protein GE061_019147 [Apolygus lucorum]
MADHKRIFAGNYCTDSDSSTSIDTAIASVKGTALQFFKNGDSQSTVDPKSCCTWVCWKQECYISTTAVGFRKNDLEVLIDSLRENDLLHYSHLLTGYIGSPSFLQKVASVVKELKSNNPKLRYVCDPVMGDDGKMYVPESLLPIYKETILPLADVITPNQYELELLSGRSITKVDDAWSAIESFHEKGCRTVIVSSSTLGGDNELIALASTKKDGKTTRAKISIPKLDAHFVGSGDLFAALMMAWLYKTDDDIQHSLENTIHSLQAVLTRTLSHALVMSKGDRPTPEQMELQLIQSKSDIESPSPSVRSTIVE